MQVYAASDEGFGLREIAEHARRVEAMGYDGLNVPDAVHDGLLLAQAALSATKRLRVATSVLVCFPRSPMNVAHAAWDLQASSDGRFQLGLGSQIRANIVGRYSATWSAPVARMREYVQSLRAIWRCWQNGERLDFSGEHYRFDRMQPFFNPGPIEHPDIPILLGAVGPRMTKLAGEVADALITHPTNGSPRYLRETTLAELAAGAAAAGRPAQACGVMAAGFVATGANSAEVARERERIRGLLAFLYSTPAYWRSLSLYGWHAAGEDLRGLTRAGRWDEMAGVVTDAMLDTLVPTGTYETIAATLGDWFASLADRVTFPLPADPGDDARAAAVIEQLKEGGPQGRP